MFVRAIRGATTVENNDKLEIINETKKLLKAVIKKNRLNSNNIVSIFFTVTRDLNAEFPAVSARELGLVDIALLCMNEIDVPHSLGKCIRVLIHFNTDKDNKDINHIYLNGATVLRPDIQNKNI